MSKPFYDSDLTDEEWQQLEPLLPSAKPVGKHREVSLSDILNARFYRADNGIKWRHLPREFPAWQTANRVWLLPATTDSGSDWDSGNKSIAPWWGKCEQVQDVMTNPV